MEFFGILHCVQDDSNYKDYCNSNCTIRSPFGDDKQNGNGRRRGGNKSKGSGLELVGLPDQVHCQVEDDFEGFVLVEAVLGDEAA
jgi:hypothetical protein